MVAPVHRQKSTSGSLLKYPYPRNAASGHAAYKIPSKITDFVGPVPSPGEFFNRLLTAGPSGHP
jgi:hypothetical protein